MQRRGQGKDKKVVEFKQTKAKERGVLTIMDQVTELTQELNEAKRHRDAYKKAWIAEKELCATYKLLANKHQADLIRCSLCSIILITFMLGVILWTQH